MAAIDVIAWNFHAGLPDLSMGLGGSALAQDRELHAGLHAAGWETRVVRVEPVGEELTEIERIFELDRRLARHVADARRRGAFPLVLGGNCISCLGTTAGIDGGGDLGAVWLDAHADFDTPEDNLSGFTDVMALAILTGSGWRRLRETIPGFSPVRERDVVLAAVRDLEPYQRERLDGSDIKTVPGSVEIQALEGALDRLRESVPRVYLHVDLDALDTSVGRANRYAAAGGPSLDTLLGALDRVFDRFEVTAAAITAYDPRVDDAEGAMAAAARRIAAVIAGRSAASLAGP
jgi:arginase